MNDLIEFFYCCENKGNAGPNEEVVALSRVQTMKVEDTALSSMWMIVWKEEGNQGQ